VSLYSPVEIGEILSDYLMLHPTRQQFLQENKSHKITSHI